MVAKHSYFLGYKNVEIKEEPKKFISHYILCKNLTVVRIEAKKKKPNLKNHFLTSVRNIF